MQERLGRSDIAITLNSYSHALPTLGRDAAQQPRGALHGDESADGGGDGAGDDDATEPGAAPVAR